jgi:CheY-like chemotaxis protein
MAKAKPIATKTVTIVDDDIDTHEEITAALSDCGLPVYSVGNGREALEQARRNGPPPGAKRSRPFEATYQYERFCASRRSRQIRARWMPA